jgi:hypothetical protein
LALPNREQAEPRWEDVAGELLKAATHGGPFCFTARVIFARALHGIEGVEPPPEPSETKQDRWKATRAKRKR